ncbi:MAG: hypothetical protein HYX22_03605 [Candidatus Yanofskybacteria bacterium]|nr:hypothetical protein [Candidatus Yanofskybacteria bacterium]
MRYRSFLLATSFVFLTSGFSPVLYQENPEEKINRLLSQLYLTPNFPKLSPVKARIDKVEKQHKAYYLRSPKRFFGLTTSRTPEIHLSEKFIRNYPDDAVLVILAHELGHHFGMANVTEFNFGSKEPLDRLLRTRELEEENQYFAEAFALYVLGEELYRKGKLDYAVTYFKEQNGVYWLYIETNPLLYNYHMNQAELWISYWFEGAKSRLDDIKFKVRLNQLLAR